MVAEGTYHWNSGMFLFRASAFLGEIERHQPDFGASLSRRHAGAHRGRVSICGSDWPENHFLRPGPTFEQAPAISIDHGVMEHTDRAWVLPVEFGWSDVGAWSALHDLGADADGNVIRGDVVALEAKDSVVHAESRLVAVLGVDNAVVVETPDAVLVADGLRHRTRSANWCRRLRQTGAKRPPTPPKSCAPGAPTNASPPGHAIR